LSAYFDASALAKKYVREIGTDRILHLARQHRPIATSILTYAEIHAALARRVRDGSLTSSHRAAAAAALQSDWRAFVVVELSDEVLSQIPDLVAAMPLRAGDAIHLASAIWLRSRHLRFADFISCDARLLDAARRSRFATTDPATP